MRQNKTDINAGPTYKTVVLVTRTADEILKITINQVVTDPDSSADWTMTETTINLDATGAQELRDQLAAGLAAVQDRHAVDFDAYRPF